MPRSPWDTEQVKVRGARPVSFWELVKGPCCPGGVQAPSPSLVAHFGVCEARCMCPTPHPFWLPCWVPRQWHQPTEPRAGNLGPERTPPAVCGRPPRGSQALRDASGRAPPPHRERATPTPALRHRVIGGPPCHPHTQPSGRSAAGAQDGCVGPRRVPNAWGARLQAPLAHAHATPVSPLDVGGAGYGCSPRTRGRPAVQVVLWRAAEQTGQSAQDRAPGGPGGGGAHTHLALVGAALPGKEQSDMSGPRLGRRARPRSGPRRRRPGRWGWGGASYHLFHVIFLEMKRESPVSSRPWPRACGAGGAGAGGPLTIMSVMVSMVWLMVSSASRLCPQSAAVKLRRYVWSVAMMLSRGSCGGRGRGGCRGGRRGGRAPPPLPSPSRRPRAGLPPGGRA